MKDLYPLFGIVTVLNTPFTDTGDIDATGLKRHVAEALEAGVSGFLVPAMASEVYKLSLDERLKMVNIVLEEVNGRVPVIAGGGSGPEGNCSIIKSYLNIGCKQVLFQIPYRDPVQFYDQFMRLAETGPEVIMLQDWDPAGYGIPDELICRLFEEVEAFRCIKIETMAAGIKYSGILRLTGGRLHVSGGWAVMQMIEGLDRGVHAFMPTGMHYIYTRIYRNYIEGRRESALNLFNKLLPVLAFSNQHIDISIQFFKRLCYRKGIFSTPNVREPVMQFDKIHETITDKWISYVIDLEEKIKRNDNDDQC